MKVFMPLVFLAGCVQDPVLIGYWQVLQVQVDDVVQEDFGTMEFDKDGKITVVQRYLWDGAAFQPNPTPEVHEVTSSGGEKQGDIYQTKGEVHLLTIGADAYEIVDYEGASCLLVGRGVAPPGSELLYLSGSQEPIPTVDVTYELQR